MLSCMTCLQLITLLPFTSSKSQTNHEAWHCLLLSTLFCIYFHTPIFFTDVQGVPTLVQSAFSKISTSTKFPFTPSKSQTKDQPWIATANTLLHILLSPTVVYLQVKTLLQTYTGITCRIYNKILFWSNWALNKR